MNDQECLAKLKEARDFVNGLNLAAKVDNVMQGKALTLIDAVADEIEDRLAKGGSLAQAN